MFLAKEPQLDAVAFATDAPPVTQSSRSLCHARAQQSMIIVGVRVRYSPIDFVLTARQY
jgi:hypothetical protein